MLRRTLLLLATMVPVSAAAVSADTPLLEVQGAQAASVEQASNDIWLSLADSAGLQWDLDMWVGRSYSAWAGALNAVGYTQPVSYTTVAEGTATGDPGSALTGYGLLQWRTSPVGQWRPYWVYEPPTLEPNGQQYSFATDSRGRVRVTRKLLIPDDDSFARWLNIVRNDGPAPQYVEFRIFGWLGYGAGSAVVTSSDGDSVAEATDLWVATRDALGTSELKTGHVLQGLGATTPPSSVSILDGTGSAAWTYAFTVPPGESAIVVTFALAQPSEATTAARAAEIGGLCGSSLAFMSAAEKGQVLNFDTSPAGSSCPDPGARPGSVEGDFDGDGQADILWRHGGTGDLYGWLMDGTTVRASATFDPSGLPDPAWKIAGVADFDGDGHQDLLWHHQGTGDLYVWFLGPAASDPAFDGGAATSVLTGAYLNPSRFADVNWQIRATEDFDGDGLTDLLWHHQVTGELYVWFLGHAAAADGATALAPAGPATTVTSGALLTPSAMPDTEWQVRGSADFNGDGVSDLLWHHGVTGELYVWFLGTDLAVTGGAALSPSAMPDTDWQIQQVADLNGDGHADITWRHLATGDLYAWFLGAATADTSLSGPVEYCTVVGGTALSPPALTDLNWRIVQQ